MSHIDKMLNINELEMLAEFSVVELGEALVSCKIINKELTLTILKQDIIKVLKFLRDNRRYSFKMLMDICGVDYPERGNKSDDDSEADLGRFDVVYHLLSLQSNLRIRVKTDVKEGDTVPSVCELFASANWYEREAYDMFGIGFENHPDLRRILNEAEFDGHPLRKDFPVEGKVEVYYDEKLKRVAYKPVDLPQETRRFDKQSSWEALTGNAKLAENKGTFVVDRDDENNFNASEFK